MGPCKWQTKEIPKTRSIYCGHPELDQWIAAKYCQICPKREEEKKV